MKSALWLPFAVALLCNGMARAEWPNVNDTVLAKVNKKLATKQVAIRKVMVLPAGVACNRIGTRGSEGGTADGDLLARSFYSAVSKELSSRGVEVLPMPPVLAGDDAARYAVADLQTEYNRLAPQLWRKPARVAKGQITLGDRVARFEPGEAGDALVFIRGSAHVPTQGRQAVAFAIGAWGAMAAEFSGRIAFADSKTGEVLAYIEFHREANMTEDTDERFADSVREALQKLPFLKR